MKKAVQAQLTAVFTENAFLVELADENHPQAAWKKEFDADRWAALLHLGFMPPMQDVSQTFYWLQKVGTAFVTALTDQPALEITREQTEVPLAEDTLNRLLDTLPYGIGTEYVNRDWIANAFETLNTVFVTAIVDYPGTVAMFLEEKSQNLRVPERIFFHLVENRNNEEYPFAFLATYSTRDAAGKVRHKPLSYALTEFKDEREKLVQLLSCLNKASDASDLIYDFMESGELFHPLKLTVDEAYRFLKSVESIEDAGIVCRLPNWWRRRAHAIGITVRLGEQEPSLLGFSSILAMQPFLTVDGVPLTQEEIEQLLSQTEGLVMIKGKWVEVDRERLKQLLAQMKGLDREISFLDALRMMGGVGGSESKGVEIENGTWLREMLEKMRQPAEQMEMDVPEAIQATLRVYQQRGYAWLWLLSQMGFGACLADDMGLGKTIQVLAYLAKMRESKPDSRALLVVPTSLLGNWEKEIERFAPNLSVCRLHGQPAAQLQKKLEETDAFLVMTTYGMVSRLEGLSADSWDCVILDEAQAIKNPGTAQSKSVKQIPSRERIAMTGTPIENDLSNLWSLFDFLNPGLLGSMKEFKNFSSTLADQPEGYAKLKRMVSPFILRRLKTDKKIISDLPEKMEQIDYVALTKKQATLYRREVKRLEENLQHADGIKRKGIVLATLTKLKQICNHPDQYLGQETYSPDESGKFTALREICEVIRDKHERVLVFTQYREITEPLAEYLTGIFGRPGLILSGETKVRQRAELVEQFNGEAYVPFMVLTVKAGGTGLNLTAASHVIHFDRWWNPAVENQATDRAYRIGQRKNVMVHKFVALNSIEEKINELMERKIELARNVIAESGEAWITEMSNEELLNLMKLEV